jgi:hypothetical protein
MDKQSSPEDVLLKGLSTWASVRLQLKDALAEFLGTCLVSMVKSADRTAKGI